MDTHLGSTILTRRDLLKLGGTAVAAGSVISITDLAAPAPAEAQTPKRGGTITIRVWDPPHFDPYLIVAFKTQIVYSFTHSRLLKHKRAPGCSPAVSFSRATSPSPGRSPTRPPTSSSYARGSGGIPSPR